jgi:hypothetical protein
MLKHDNHMRCIGMKPLHNNRILPPNPAFIDLESPTFYVGDITTDELLEQVELWTRNKYTLGPPTAPAQDGKPGASTVGGKRKGRSDEDTTETTTSDRKLMHALAASVSKMEQQFTKLLQTRADVNPCQKRDKDEYVKEEHGGHIRDTRDVVELVNSTDDSSGSTDTLNETATRTSLHSHPPASKKTEG